MSKNTIPAIADTMNENNKKEKEYLKSVYMDKMPNENPFIIRVDDDKEAFWIGSSDETFGKELDLISQYRTLYDTCLELARKTIFSLDKAIDYAFSDNVIEKFDPLILTSREEWKAYYYIENALFRIESLWDILAQLVNIKYELGLNEKQVYHNRIFSTNGKYINKYWKNGIPNTIKKIADYVNEEDDTSGNGMWKGNYQYIKEIRNDLTHRVSISQSMFSNYSFKIKPHPSFIVKRAAECFAVVEDFIYDMVEDIMEKSDNFHSID